MYECESQWFSLLTPSSKDSDLLLVLASYHVSTQKISNQGTCHATPMTCHVLAPLLPSNSELIPHIRTSTLACRAYVNEKESRIVRKKTCSSRSPHVVPQRGLLVGKALLDSIDSGRLTGNGLVAFHSSFRPKGMRYAINGEWGKNQCAILVE